MKKLIILKFTCVTFLRWGVGVLVFFCFCFSLAAQYGNGSAPGSEYIDLLIQNRIEEEQVQVDTLNPQLNVSLDIQVFVVNSEDGEAHFFPAELSLGILSANKFFENIGIQFHTSDYQIVPEYEYAVILHKDSTVEMQVKYAKKDYINLFLVDSINLEEWPYHGYTTFPVDSLYNSIFLNKEYLSGNYITALLGNFMGLLNTHESFGGEEAVNRQNCAEAGDYLCDTEADPGLGGYVNEECLYGGMAFDGNGDYYVPTVANLMSDSNDFCKCIFTNQQYRRMKFYYMNYRDYLR